LQMFQQLYPGDHPSVATSLNNVASCLQALGRAAEALPKYESALEMFRHVFPAGHPTTLFPQVSLAEVLITLKRYGESERLLRDAARQCRRSEQSRQLHWPRILKSLVALYDAWDAADPEKGYNKKADRWRARLAEYQASTQPAASS